MRSKWPYTYIEFGEVDKLKIFAEDKPSKTKHAKYITIQNKLGEQWLVRRRSMEPSFQEFCDLCLEASIESESEIIERIDGLWTERYILPYFEISIVLAFILTLILKYSFGIV